MARHQTSPDLELAQRDWKKGTLSGVSERGIARPNWLAGGDNLYGHPYRGLRVRPGSRDLSTAVLSDEPHSLMCFYSLVGSQLFVAAGSTIFEAQEEAYPPQTMPDSYLIGSDIWSHANLDGILVATQLGGGLTPLEYDGAWKTLALPKPTVAPSFAADSAGGSVDAGTHYYRVRWRHAKGNSVAGPATAAHVVAASNFTVNLTGLNPTSPRADYVGWTLERTKVNGTANGPWWFDSEGTSDSAASTRADSQLDYVADDGLHGEPPHLDGITSFAGRLFGWAGSLLYASQAAYGDLEATGIANWDADNVYPVAVDEGDEIQTCVVVIDQLLILKRHSVHVLSGVDPDSFVLTPVVYADPSKGSEAGCAGPRAATVIGGIAYFWGDGGTFMYSGGKVKDAGWTEVGRYIEEANKSALDRVVMHNHQGNFLLAFYPPGTSLLASEQIVYDPRFRQWWHWKGWTARDAIQLKTGIFGNAQMVICDPSNRASFGAVTAGTSISGPGIQAATTVSTDVLAGATSLLMDKIATVTGKNVALTIGSTVVGRCNTVAGSQEVTITEYHCWAVFDSYNDEKNAALAGSLGGIESVAPVEMAATFGAKAANVLVTTANNDIIFYNVSPTYVKASIPIGLYGSKMSMLAAARAAMQAVTGAGVQMGYGFHVKANANDKFYYSISTGSANTPMVATIAESEYANSTTYAAALQTALNTAEAGRAPETGWAGGALVAFAVTVVGSKIQVVATKNAGFPAGSPSMFIRLAQNYDVNGGATAGYQLGADKNPSFVGATATSLADYIVATNRVLLSISSFVASLGLGSNPAGTFTAAALLGLSTGSNQAWPGTFSGSSDPSTGADTVMAHGLGAALGANAWPAGATLVSTGTANARTPVICGDGFGNFIVAWSDERAGSSNFDIYAQKYDAAGAPLWTASGVVVIATASAQTVPAIIPDGFGGAIVCWQTNLADGGDIYAQRISAGGVLQWPGLGAVVSSPANTQANPVMCSDAAGGCIIAWTDLRGGVRSQLYAQRVSSIGAFLWTPDGVPLTTDTTKTVQDLRILADGSGGAVISFRDTLNSSSDDIRAQRVNNAGAALWTAGGVLIRNDTTGGSTTEDRGGICLDGAGGFIFAWARFFGATIQQVYVQRLDALGAPQWTSGGIAISAGNPVFSYFPAIVSDLAGGALLFWVETQSGTIRVRGQRIDATGAVAWGAGAGVVLDSWTLQTAILNCAAVSDGIGGAFVLWYRGTATGYSVYAQRVNPNGVAMWGSPILVRTDALYSGGSASAFLGLAASFTQVVSATPAVPSAGGIPVRVVLETPWLDGGLPNDWKDADRIRFTADGNQSGVAISVKTDPPGGDCGINVNSIGQGNDWAADVDTNPNALVWDIGSWAADAPSTAEAGLPAGTIGKRFKFTATAEVSGDHRPSELQCLATLLPDEEYAR